MNYLFYFLLQAAKSKIMPLSLPIRVHHFVFF